jgi:regulatory protein
MKKQLRAQALRLLSGREYGRVELAQRLQRRRNQDTSSDEFSIQVLVEEVLNELEAQGWLKDSRAASLWATQRAKGHGDLAIRRALHQRGFSEACVTQALEALETTELDRAYMAWNKQFKDKSEAKDPIDPDEKEVTKQEKWVLNQAKIRWKAKQQRFLMNRGFSADVVATVLKHADAD